MEVTLSQSSSRSRHSRSRSILFSKPAAKVTIPTKMDFNQKNVLNTLNNNIETSQIDTEDKNIDVVRIAERELNKAPYYGLYDPKNLNATFPCKKQSLIDTSKKQYDKQTSKKMSNEVNRIKLLLDNNDKSKSRAFYIRLAKSKLLLSRQNFTTSYIRKICEKLQIDIVSEGKKALISLLDNINEE